MTEKYILIPSQQGEAFRLPHPHGGIINFKLNPQADSSLPLSCMINELPPGGEIPLHHHDDYIELFMALQGSVVATLGDDVCEFSQGMIVLVKPHTKHKFNNTGKETFRYLDILLTNDTSFSDYVHKTGKPL